jgi:hypothetical protein
MTSSIPVPASADKRDLRERRASAVKRLKKRRADLAPIAARKLVKLRAV